MDVTWEVRCGKTRSESVAWEEGKEGKGNVRATQGQTSLVQHWQMEGIDVSKLALSLCVFSPIPWCLS
jgi:hypothetical protein